MYMMPILFFILGAIIGSFLNVVILRYNTGRSVGGRSACPSCNHALAWYELLPVVSFLFLRGRCRTCLTKISPQYALVELSTGLLFAATAFMFPLTGFALWLTLIISSISMVIFVYDIRHTIIPDGMVFTLIGIGFLLRLYEFIFFGIDTISILNLLGGLIIFTFFWFLWFVSQGTWMGFGDAKLGLAIGWILGFSAGITAIMVGFWLGAIVGILMIIWNKLVTKSGLSMKSEVPFAPFLLIGFALAFFLQLDLMWIASVSTLPF
jgi:prepilin signal peptidase PulO-like enzyme (type II secretory pathway)